MESARGESVAQSVVAAPVYATALRVLLDARKLGHGGIGVYIENLVDGHLENGSVDLSILLHPGVDLPPRWSGRVKVLRDSSPLYSIDELVRLSRRIEWSHYDLFHSPHFTLPRNLPIASVITVHDLMHLMHPERVWYPLIATPLIRSSCSRAHAIIAVSRATRDDLAAFLGPRKLASTPLSVIPNAYQSLEEVPSTPVEGRYLLSVHSNAKPHKGLRDLLAAFSSVAHEIPDMKLVLAGAGITREATESSSRVIRIGPVSRPVLSSLYRNATALVVSSIAEGFCLPVLEAHAHGVPVIARPVPAVRELLEPCDLEVSSWSVSALAEGMKVAASRPPLCEQTRRRLRDHVYRDYSVGAVARATFSVYQSAISERGA
jgi:glycosyltransferase involved in cell wall biosynthesis